MPVWLSLGIAAFATAGMFFTLYLAVVGVVEARRAKAAPRVGICPGEGEGQLGFYVKWDPKMFNLAFFRIKMSHYSPENKIKEGAFSLSYDPPQKESFLQIAELPSEFKDLLAEGQAGKKAIFTVDFRTTDGFVVAKNILLSDLKKIYFKQKGKAPALNKLELAKPDLPDVSTLDYDEWVERKGKLKRLMDEAKAKAAKAKPAPAPAPAAAAPQPAVAEVPKV